MSTRPGPATCACHAGRGDLGRLGVHAPPLDLSSTYPLHDLDAAEDAFDAYEQVGLEDVDDLWADLAQALASCRRRRPVGAGRRAAA